VRLDEQTGELLSIEIEHFRKFTSRVPSLRREVVRPNFWQRLVGRKASPDRVEIGQIIPCFA
jgi:hypothetical protein